MSLAILQQFHHVFSHFGLCADCSFLHLQEAWTRSKMVFQRHHALADHFHLELGALPDIVDTIYVHTVYYSILYYILYIDVYRSYFFPPIHNNVSDISRDIDTRCLWTEHLKLFIGQGS